MSRKILKGVVISTKMTSTAVVRVSTAKTHARYKKNYVTRKNYKVHCEKDEVKEGDQVLIEETAPVSKTKTWRIVKEK